MRHSSSDDEEMHLVDTQQIENVDKLIWGQFYDNESSRLTQKKYKDHSPEFNAYLLINNYERVNPCTETYVKTWILNYILYIKPDINFKDEHTDRNFYSYIIRDKQLSQNTKVSLTMACLKVYDWIDYFFSKDIYGYTALHYCLLMEHYKVVIQILMYWAKTPGFQMPYYVNMEGQHEFHEHPLTFFLWKSADKGIKEGSKRETVLRLLLKYTGGPSASNNIDILLIKNKDGISIYDYLLQKDALIVNSSKKQYRNHLINIVRESQLRAKYLFWVLKSRPLSKLSTNLKVLIALNLA